MEVALLDRTVLQVEFTVQGRGQPVHDRAFHLRPHDVRVHGDAAIHHAEHAVDLDRAVIDGNLRHLRHIGAERVVRSESQMAARTPWPLAQPLSSNPDDIVQPGLILGVAQPELHRIQARLGGEFVHHRFLGERRVGVPNRPPEGERQPVVDGHVAHFAVRGVVILVQPLDAGVIHHPAVKRAVGEAHHPIDDAVAHRLRQQCRHHAAQRVRRDVAADALGLPRGQAASIVNACLDPHQGGRAVDAALNVVLTAPQHLDRLVGGHRQLSGLNHMGERRPAAKAAAEIGVVRPDLRLLQSGETGH